MEHFLIVGLGNPGIEYDNTRHNIGFTIVDALAKNLDISLTTQKFSSIIGSKTFFNYKVTIAKPQTFMNLSGGAVAKILNFYKIPLANLIIIHDDLDIDFAKTKVKSGGGSGGHNGIKSIDQSLGSPNYYRVRLGIGKPPLTINTSSYVLQKFNKGEEKIITNLVKDFIDNFELLLKQDITNFMNKMSMEYKKYGI